MKVTLKKAAALAALLSTTTVQVNHAYAVDPYSDTPTEDFVKTARDLLGSQIAATVNLIGAQYTIRTLIGQANQGKINELLTTRAFIDRQIAILNGIPVRKRGTNLETLARKLEAKKAAGEGVRYGLASETLELETDELISPLLRSLRKKKREVDEELATLNFTTTIELPAEVVKLLTELDFI